MFVYDPHSHHCQQRLLTCTKSVEDSCQTTHPEPGEQSYDLDCHHKDKDKENSTRSNDGNNNKHKDNLLFLLVTFVGEQRKVNPKKGGNSCSPLQQSFAIQRLL